MPSIKVPPKILKDHPGAFTQDDLDRKARFTGTLLGLAVGDCLGAPYEFDTADTVAKKAPNGPTEITGGGKFGWKPGEPTDDTQLALLLLESIVEAGGKLDVNDHALRLIRWLNSKPKDVGETTRLAIENLRGGEPPAQSGALAWEDQGRNAAGNGSVMYCAPVALLDVRAQDMLAEDAARVSRITHYDPRCVASCVAVTTAIAGLIRGESDAVERAALAAQSLSDDVRVAVERASSRPPEALTVDGADRGYCVLTTELAFSALAHAQDFESGLVRVVSRGGDTDTNAAVAGALLGAKFGRGAIPERWTKVVQAAPKLVSLCDALSKVVLGR